MRLSEIHLRDPFVFAEDGVYYLYGTRRGFDGGLYLILHSPNVNPNERPRHSYL